MDFGFLPRISSKIASTIKTKPCAPASTTPASFKTGRSSGVFARLSLAFSKTAVNNLLKSFSFFAKLTACWEDSLITVKIVPSTGSSKA